MSFLKITFLGSYGSANLRVSLWYAAQPAVLVSVAANGESSAIQAFKRIALRAGQVRRGIDLQQLSALLSSHSASLEILTAKPTRELADRAVPHFQDQTQWLEKALKSLEAELDRARQDEERFRGVADLPGAEKKLTELKGEITGLTDELLQNTKSPIYAYKSDFGIAPRQTLERMRLHEYRALAREQESDLRQRIKFTQANRLQELEEQRRKLLGLFQAERKRVQEREAEVARVAEESVSTAVVVTVRSRCLFTKGGFSSYVPMTIREVAQETTSLCAKLRERLDLRFDEADETLALTPVFLASPASLRSLSDGRASRLAEAMQQAFGLVPIDAHRRTVAEMVGSVIEAMPQAAERSDLSRFPAVGDVSKKRLAYLGLALDMNSQLTGHPIMYDIDAQGPRHASVTGGSGSGKSVAARVLVEGVLLHRVPVVVFDPTRSWTGFSKPASQETLVRNGFIHHLRPEWARSFETRFFSIRTGPDASQLLRSSGLTVIPAWSLGAEEERKFVAGLLRAVQVEVASWPESSRLVAMLVFEEAHRYLFDKTLEPVLEVLARTARAKGLGLLFISQNCVDLPPGIRNNTATRFQLQTGYGPDLTRAAQIFGSDHAKKVPSLRQGTGVINYPEFGTALLSFRPPLHSLDPLPENEAVSTSQAVEELMATAAAGQPHAEPGYGPEIASTTVEGADWKSVARQVATKEMTWRDLQSELEKRGVSPPSERTLRRLLQSLR